MKRLLRFIFYEIIIFLVMGAITFFETRDFLLFQSAVSFIKTPASWFVGLSLAFIFSYFFQGILISFFRKDIVNEERKKDFFTGFIIATVITSVITPYIRQLTLSFFNLLVPYFHVIILQAMIIFYFLFKLNGKYEISGKYFLTNQAIVLFYTAIILSMIA